MKNFLREARKIRKRVWIWAIHLLVLAGLYLFVTNRFAPAVLNNFTASYVTTYLLAVVISGVIIILYTRISSRLWRIK